MTAFWERWFSKNLSNHNKSKHTSRKYYINIGVRTAICYMGSCINRMFPVLNGLSRVAELKTASGIIRRAVTKLALLPIDKFDTQQSSEEGHHRDQPSEDERFQIIYELLPSEKGHLQDQYF